MTTPKVFLRIDRELEELGTGLLIVIEYMAILVWNTFGDIELTSLDDWFHSASCLYVYSRRSDERWDKDVVIHCMEGDTGREHQKLRYIISLTSQRVFDPDGDKSDGGWKPLPPGMDFSAAKIIYWAKEISQDRINANLGQVAHKSSEAHSRAEFQAQQQYERAGRGQRERERRRAHDVATLAYSERLGVFRAARKEAVPPPIPVERLAAFLASQEEVIPLPSPDNGALFESHSGYNRCTGGHLLIPCDRCRMSYFPGVLSFFQRIVNARNS